MLKYKKLYIRMGKVLSFVKALEIFDEDKGDERNAWRILLGMIFCEMLCFSCLDVIMRRDIV